MKRAAVFVLLALVACSDPPPLPQARSTVPPATQRSLPLPETPGDDGGGPGGNGGGGPGPSGNGGPGPGSGGGKGFPPPLTDDRSARPPARGIYRFRVVTTTESEGDTSSFRSFLTATRGRARDDDGEWIQRETIQTEGSSSSETYTYRGDAGSVRQTKRVQHAGSGRIVCTYTDPLRVLDLPLERGLEWRERSPECEQSGSGSSATRARMRFEVLRTEVIVVDRTRVRCWVIRRVTRTPPVTEEGEPSVSRELSWFAPAYSLVVRRESRSATTRSVQSLLNLEPFRA